MLATLRNALPDLSPAQRRVAQWILEHPKASATITLARLAAECQTSEPTVLRLCREIGLRSFRDLGLRLTEDLSNPGIYVHRDVSSDDSTSDAVIKVMDASIQSLIDMRSQLSSMPIEETVAAMKNARQIAFAGLGASGHVATDACHKFFRLGIPCTALCDIPMILQFSSIAGPRDVLVLLSHTGRWPEFEQAARLASERGATVVALTNPDSEVARAVELLFPCRFIEDTSVYTPMSSRLAQLALLDAIQVALALAQGDIASENLRLTKDALSKPFS